MVNTVTPKGVTLSFTAPQGVASGYVYVWKNADLTIGLVDNVVLAAA